VKGETARFHVLCPFEAKFTVDYRNEHMWSALALKMMTCSEEAIVSMQLPRTNLLEYSHESPLTQRTTLEFEKNTLTGG
jgi:hypothetical protein